MYYQSFKNAMVLHNLRSADVARLAGVSRAAITKWHHVGVRAGFVNVESRHLVQLASALNMPPESLLKQRDVLAAHQTLFLWDNLYPDMEHFVQALKQRRHVALARLVQVVGIAEAKKVLGQSVTKEFDVYKKFIKPARRRQLEMICPLYR